MDGLMKDMLETCKAIDKQDQVAHCPTCNHVTIPIVRGYPSQGTLEKARAGKVKLGGCVIRTDRPMMMRWCTTCHKGSKPTRI